MHLNDNLGPEVTKQASWIHPPGLRYTHLDVSASRVSGIPAYRVHLTPKTRVDVIEGCVLVLRA